MKEIAAIETTSFKLEKGYDMNDFIKVNENIDPWLKLQPGFRSRHMAETGGGKIVDMLIWDSSKQGTESMHRLLDEFADSPIHSMIDQSTVDWGILPVYHEISINL